MDVCGPMYHLLLKYVYALVAVLIVIVPISVAASPVLIERVDRSYRLTTEVEFLFDETHELLQEDVAKSEDWRYIDRHTINFGFRPEALWLRMKLQVSEAGEYVLHLPYPLLDHLDNFSFINGQPLPVIETGDAHVFSSRPTNHIDFVFPYLLESQDTLTVYLRVVSNGSLDVPLDFLGKALFTSLERDNTFLEGL